MRVIHILLLFLNILSVIGLNIFITTPVKIIDCRAERDEGLISVETTTHTHTYEEIPVDPKVHLGLTCPESDGFFKLPGSSQCFKAYFDEYRTWSEADDHCRASGLALAEPKNPIQLRKNLKERYGVRTYWVGGVGTGFSFQFQRGGEELYPDNSLWAAGEPRNNDLTSTRCLVMKDWSGYSTEEPSPYETYPCSASYPWTICEVVLE